MVEEVIVKTLEQAPPDATHWSTRSMAEAMGISQTSVSQIWRAFGIKPANRPLQPRPIASCHTTCSAVS